MSDGAIAAKCGVSRPAVVAGLRQLLELCLVEKVGGPVNQIQAYRICHPMFKPTRDGDTGALEFRKIAEGVVPPVHSCAKCHRPCKRLTRGGYCRGCTAEIDLARQIREVWAENPGITAEELAYKIKDRAKLKRLTARVRRVMLEEFPRLDQVPFAPELGNCAEAESPPRQYRVGQEGSA
jgi:DNA-binding Lrp family transcriptional regulator